MQFHEEMTDVHKVVEKMRLEGIDVADVIRGNTYLDCSTLAVVPTRGLIHPKVVHAWIQLMRPLNQRYALLFIDGDEVGVAYNHAIEKLISDPKLSSFNYMLTLEDDNIVPPMILHLLLNASIKHGFDVVGGLYHMKNAMNIPMAFGHPEKRDGDGQFDMQPRDLTETLLQEKPLPVEVNGLACGATLWKAEIFREIPPPWFETWTKLDHDGAQEVITQDLRFCRKLREKGKRLAVDTRARVGHIDTTTGTIY